MSKTIKSKVQLSVCVITREQDADNLARMIDSLPEGVEICLVTTSKGDKDEFIQSESFEHEGRVYRCGNWTYSKHFDFSRARNYSIELATNDWCVWMDSDDVFLREQHKDLLDIPTLPGGIGGVIFGCFGFHADWMPKQDNGQYYSLEHCRAFRKSTGARFRGLVHEQIYQSIADLGYKIYKSALAVVHLGYADLNIQTYKAKIDRNLKLLEIQVATDSFQREEYEEKLLQTLATKQQLKEKTLWQDK